MAYSFDPVTSSELGYMAEDKPMLVAAHALRDGEPSKAIWTQTGNTTDTDTTEDDQPTTRAYDGFMNWGNHTRPATAGDPRYLAVQLATVQEFDCLVLHGLGLHLATTITVEVADNAIFDSNLIEIVSVTPGSTNDRYVELDLHHTGSVPLRYSDVEFLRLKFTGSIKPAVSEFWLGRRRQLWHHPEVPVDDGHQVSRVSSVISEGGVVTSSTVEIAGARRSYRMTPAPGMIDELESFWDECNEGSDPFFLIETPETAPAAYLMRHDDSAVFDPILIGNATRQWSMPMIEQAPFLGVE